MLQGQSHLTNSKFAPTVLSSTSLMKSPTVSLLFITSEKNFGVNYMLLYPLSNRLHSVRSATNDVIVKDDHQRATKWSVVRKLGTLDGSKSVKSFSFDTFCVAADASYTVMSVLNQRRLCIAGGCFLGPSNVHSDTDVQWILRQFRHHAEISSVAIVSVIY